MVLLQYIIWNRQITMNGIMNLLIKQLDFFPLLVIFGVGIWFILREIKQNQASLKEQIDNLQKEFDTKIDRLREHSDENRREACSVFRKTY